LAEPEVLYFSRRAVDAIVCRGWRRASRGRLPACATPVGHHGGQPGPSQRPDEAVEGGAGLAGTPVLSQLATPGTAQKEGASATNGPSSRLPCGRFPRGCAIDCGRGGSRSVQVDCYFRGAGVRVLGRGEQTRSGFVVGSEFCTCASWDRGHSLSAE
jgi:hypothetical protein